jgi:dipeptidyl aminopeptidase/acylaminoacyl peptidase
VVGEAAIAWLAYDAQPDDEQRGIYLTSAARGGGCFERVTPSDVTAKQPSFSDDGKLIAYAAEDERGRYQIHVVELATGATRQVTQLPQGASYPAFSPSGGGIAFVTGDPEALRDGLVEEAPGAGDLMQVDLKTLETTVIRPMQSDDAFPYFSPAFSGNRIFFSNSYKMLGAFFMPSGTTIKELAPSLGTLAQDPRRKVARLRGFVQRLAEPVHCRPRAWLDPKLRRALTRDQARSGVHLPRLGSVRFHRGRAQRTAAWPLFA